MSATSGSHDPISLEAFLQEARAFLDGSAKLRHAATTGFEWGVGDDRVAIFEEPDPDEELAMLAEARAWRAARFDAGFGWITGPVEHGGRGLSMDFERAYLRLESKYDTPQQDFFIIGLCITAHVILAHATDEVRSRFLAPMHRGDVIACQLFSEPNVGSDLAGLELRAHRDGDTWVLNGQKIWTSGAHYSDIGEILCRTNPDVPKHRGLTGFMVDMHAPGVEVRPLRQMTGGSSFNEVFFDDVQVPDAWRLGDVDDGWNVAITTLMHERAMVSGGTNSGSSVPVTSLGRLVGLLESVGRADDPLLRQQVARIYTEGCVASWTTRRAMDRVRSGQPPGPEFALGKLHRTENLRTLAAFVSSVLGPSLAADTGEWGTFAWTQLVMGVPGLRVAGGTDEIQRNIIAERVLGLPKDAGSGSNVAFRDLLRNPT
jgi:alkylation response protein AidB-like acyl-CoA dehydrogenase